MNEGEDRFGFLYEGIGAESGSIPRGEFLLKVHSREKRIREYDMISPKTEHGRDDIQTKRIVGLMRAHGYYILGGGVRLAKVTGEAIEEIGYERFHIVLGQFCLLGNCVPRTRRKDGYGVIDIMMEHDLPDIEGYTGTHKFVAVSMTRDGKNQIASKIFQQLDTCEGIMEQPLFTEGLGEFLGYQEGFQEETKIFSPARPYLRYALYAYKDFKVEDYRAQIQTMLGEIFGNVPSYDAFFGCGLNGLLFMVVATILRNYIGACPFFWISTRTKEGQGAGKTHIGKQLQILAGQTSDECLLTLSTACTFDIGQFARDWNRALLNEKNRVVIIDNFVGEGVGVGQKKAKRLLKTLFYNREEAIKEIGSEEEDVDVELGRIKHIALLSTFGTYGAKRISLNLTGRGEGVEVNARRIVVLNGNGIVPHGDWKRRSLYMCLRAPERGQRLTSHYMKAHEASRIEMVRGFFISAYRLWLETKPDEQVCTWAYGYSTYSDTFQRLVPFIEWLSGGDDGSFREGRGYVTDEPVGRTAGVSGETFKDAWANLHGEDWVGIDALDPVLWGYLGLDAQEKNFVYGGRLLKKKAEECGLSRRISAGKAQYRHSRDFFVGKGASSSVKNRSVENLCLQNGQFWENRPSLEGVVRNYGISLKSRGLELVCLCPFHEEKTPSCTLYKREDGKELFKCFGCGEHGDVYDFVEKIESLPSYEMRPWRTLSEGGALWARGDPLIVNNWLRARLFEGVDKLEKLVLEPYWREKSLVQEPLYLKHLRVVGGEHSQLYWGLCCIGKGLQVTDSYQRTQLYSGDEGKTFQYCRDEEGKHIRRFDGAVSGGMIPLLGSLTGNFLCIAEGIETALSWALVRREWIENETGRGHSFLVASGLSSTFLPKIEIPEQIEHILVIQDGDEAGEKACTLLRKVAIERNIHFLVDAAPAGKDFNDVWVEEGMKTKGGNPLQKEVS